MAIKSEGAGVHLRREEVCENPERRRKPEKASSKVDLDPGLPAQRAVRKEILLLKKPGVWNCVTASFPERG